MSTGTNPGRGGLILTLGILGILCCAPLVLTLGNLGFLCFGPLGIPALVMGSRDIKRIEQGKIPQHARGMTQTGMILGIIVVVAWVFAVVIQLLGLYLST